MKGSTRHSWRPGARGWKQPCAGAGQALGWASQVPSAVAQRVLGLERKLRRKDAALVETAALLVLKILLAVDLAAGRRWVSTFLCWFSTQHLHSAIRAASHVVY